MYVNTHIYNTYLDLYYTHMHTTKFPHTWTITNAKPYLNTLNANVHPLFRSSKINLTDINVSFNCLIISPKVWIIRVYPSPVSLRSSLRLSFPSLSHGKAANAIKSNVRKTIALNDMFVARSSPPPSPFLPPASPTLCTRAYRSIIRYTYTRTHVYAHPRRRNSLYARADNAVNVCKLSSLLPLVTLDDYRSLWRWVTWKTCDEFLRKIDRVFPQIHVMCIDLYKVYS